MKKVCAFFFLITLGLVTSCSTVQWIPYVKVNFINMFGYDISKDEFAEEFDAIHNVVSANYPYYNKKGLTPDSMYLNYSKQVSEVRYKADFIQILLQYFSELSNSHSQIYLIPSGVKCSPILVEDTLFLDQIWDEEMKDLGIQPGDIVLEINGTPTMDWLEQQTIYAPGSTSAGKMDYSVQMSFASFSPESRSYIILTDEGEKEITLDFFPAQEFVDLVLDSIGEEYVTSSVIEGNIGYLDIRSMMGNGSTMKELYSIVVEEFIQEYETLKELPYLIVDIRNNGGGHSGVAEKLSEYMITEPQEACLSHRMLEPANDRFMGKIVLLTSLKSASAAECFAINLKESGNVTLIGSPTNGDPGGGWPLRFRTVRGLCFVIPVDSKERTSAGGFPLEGVGLEPHLFVEQTVEDYLNDRDTVLEYAIDYLMQPN